MIGIRSPGILRIPHLPSFLGTQVHKLWLQSGRAPADIVAIAGWGRRPTAEKSRHFARRHQLPFISLEDGFLRSCGLGVQGAQPLSLVVDDLNIYYDATQPSRLESLIVSLVLDENLRSQSIRALDLIRRHRLSKYNHAPERQLPPSFVPGMPRVLVIDQTLGDVSVSLGRADAGMFRQMLSAALAENPQAEILVKIHPDVLSGKKQGYLGEIPHDRVRLLAEDVSPLSLLEQVDKVYVVTSQMGFEALMLHKPVVCFGQPWYAGWGLTDDRHPEMPALQARRTVERSLEELFAAAYLQYARYIQPATGQPGTIFDVIDWLARNKAANDATRGGLYCIGMSLWKRAIVRPFLLGPASQVSFIRSVKALGRRSLPADAKLVIWGIKDEAAVRAVAAARNLPVWRMEDGFLRSVGLGSDLYRPVSLVLDKGGMYYDPASGSDLETMLATQALNGGEIDRAARFRRAFVSMRASKYNLSHTPLDVQAKGRRVILVPGQVEDDASIMRGSPVVRSNAALLEAVRNANPDAYIIYKPHPDVVAGNRRGAVETAALARLADQCVMDANIIDCILAADEVHTMTSLAGFEALMHGRIVHCYGGPFYAGWGLTQDHFALPHRRRQVSLDELVFAAVLNYPRYALPGVQGFVSAEDVLQELVQRAGHPADSLHKTGTQGWIARKLRKAKAIGQLLGVGFGGFVVR
jgi:capsular polysaccharide export protein